MRTKQRTLFLEYFKRRIHEIDVEIYILRPLLTKQITKLRAVWGKQFEKGQEK
jgi:F0F1-type ATP synthase delta subunit